MTGNDPRLIKIREALKLYPIVQPKTVSDSLDLVEGDDNFVLPAGFDDLMITTGDRCDIVVIKSGELLVLRLS